MRKANNRYGPMKGLFLNSRTEPCDLHGGRDFDLGEEVLEEVMKAKRPVFLA